MQDDRFRGRHGLHVKPPVMSRIQVVRCETDASVVHEYSDLVFFLFLVVPERIGCVGAGSYIQQCSGVLVERKRLRSGFANFYFLDRGYILYIICNNDFGSLSQIRIERLTACQGAGLHYLE